MTQPGIPGSLDRSVDLKRAVDEAQRRIAPHALRTPLQPSEWLSQACGFRVFLKLENLQHTGSFKVRGAFNRLLSLQHLEAHTQVVTGSSGNHGIAVAYAASRLGLRATVFVP